MQEWLSKSNFWKKHEKETADRGHFDKSYIRPIIQYSEGSYIADNDMFAPLLNLPMS